MQQISPELQKVLCVGFIWITPVSASDCAPSAVCKMRYWSKLELSLNKMEVRLAVRRVSAYPCLFLRSFCITLYFYSSQFTGYVWSTAVFFLILNRVGLPGFKQSWIITFMNVKIRSITWTLFSSRQVFFFPMGTCSNVKFIFSCSGYCNMLYLEWPYRSTSCALGHFCWHEMGNFSSSSFSQYVLWVLSIGCSGLVFFWILIGILFLRIVDPNYLIPVSWREFSLIHHGSSGFVIHSESS